MESDFVQQLREWLLARILELSDVSSDAVVLDSQPLTMDLAQERINSALGYVIIVAEETLNIQDGDVAQVSIPVLVVVNVESYTDLEPRQLTYHIATELKGMVPDELDIWSRLRLGQVQALGSEGGVVVWQIQWIASTVMTDSGL